MTADPRAALLREFVRLHIPQASAEVGQAIKEARRRRKIKFSWDLRGLRRRKAKYHRDFLRASDFDAAVKRLTEAFEHDCEEIEVDPKQPHFQSWRATDSDWRTLAIGLAFDRDPASFGLTDDDSRKGEDHRYYDLVMTNVVKETGGNAKKAAPIAAKYINSRIDAGEFTRQSAENPREHVDAEQVRQAYSTRKATRNRLLKRMLPDSLDTFTAWANSPQCPISQEIVTAILPPERTIERWVKSERAMATRFNRFRAERAASTDAEEQALFEEFYIRLDEGDKEAFSSWSWKRLQAHFDKIESNLVGDAERNSFRITRQTLVSTFLQHRREFNGAIMDQVLDEDLLPYHVRRLLHAQKCFQAAQAAADSLSLEGKL